MMILSIFEVEKMVENDKFSPQKKNGIEILLSAINDWSTPLNNLCDYDLAVQNFIEREVTKSNIESALSKIDLSRFAWEAESLSSLIEVFDYFKESNTLSEIIIEIKEHCPE
jgi:hypothetical protein